MAVSRFDFGEFTASLVEQVCAAVIRQADNQLRTWSELVEQTGRPVAELFGRELAGEEEEEAELARRRLAALLAAGLPRISVTAGEIETRVTFFGHFRRGRAGPLPAGPAGAAGLPPAARRPAAVAVVTAIAPRLEFRGAGGERSWSSAAQGGGRRHRPGALAFRRTTPSRRWTRPPGRTDGRMDKASGLPPENEEWRLEEMLDAIGRQIDRAGDRAALKSYGRGFTYWPTRLSLDLQVTVRVAADGAVPLPHGRARNRRRHRAAPRFFPPGARAARGREAPPRRLRQLAAGPSAQYRARRDRGARRPFDLHHRRSRALGRERRPARRASRHSGVAEIRLRGWLGLPFLIAFEELPGEPVRLLLSGLGLLPGDGGKPLIFFGGREGTVDDATAVSLLAAAPPDAAGGPVYAEVAGVCTNALRWDGPGTALPQGPPPSSG